MRARGISDADIDHHAGRQPAAPSSRAAPRTDAPTGAADMTMLQPDLIGAAGRRVPRRRGVAEPGRRRRAHAAPMASPLQPSRPGPPGARSRRGDRVGSLIGNDGAAAVADLLPGHPQGGGGGGARCWPVSARRSSPGFCSDAGASWSPCAARSFPALRAAGRHGGRHGSRRRRALGRPALPGRRRPGPASRPGRRRRHHVHLGDDRATEGRGRPARRPLDHGPGAVPVAGPRLPVVLPLRHHQRVAPRLRPAARRAERVVPARASAPEAWVDGGRERIAPSPPSWCRPWWSSSSASPRFGSRRPLEPGRGHGGQRADRRRHPAALRGGPARRRGPVRLRHDRVRRRDRPCRWATAGGTWVRSASRCPASRSGSSTPTAPTCRPGRSGEVTDRRNRPGPFLPATTTPDADGHRRTTAGCAAETSAPSTATATSGSSAGKKEIIIRGGHNVVPGEVEAALFEHPAVVEAAVAGSRTPSSVRTWRPGWCCATTHPPTSCAPSSWTGWRTTRCPAGLPWSTRSPERERQGRQVPPGAWRRPGVTTSFSTLTRRTDRPWSGG